MQEGLAARDVELAHSRVAEEAQAVFRVVERQDVARGVGVEAEAAGVVALAGGEVVDGDGGVELVVVVGGGRAVVVVVCLRGEEEAAAEVAC